ncbi:MAG: hypothetical protein WCE52_22090 [Candidatus Acidiferrum sp.]
MILRLSDSISRALGVIAAVFLAAAICYFAVRMALGSIATQRENAASMSAATRWEPRNSEYWYRLGHFQEFDLEDPDPAGATASLRKAVQLNPQYTDAWLDLATSLELEGDTQRAQDAYLRAERSYPNSAEVAWRYANFLLRTGDLSAAFSELHRAIQGDPHRAAAAFSRAYRADPNLDEILEKVIPPIPSVYVDVISEATASQRLAFAQIVWQRLLALKPRLNVGQFDPLVYALASDKEYVQARRVWDQGTSTMSLPPLFEPQGSVVWDPSFESGIEGSTFAWHYKPLDQGVRVSLDSSEKLSGTQSLRLSFDGNHNPGLDLACTSAIVTPGTSYHLTAWIKARDVTTEQGVHFRIASSVGKDTLPIATKEFHGSLPWTFVDVTWTAGNDVHGAGICIGRDPSDNPDVRISGDVWIDDVNLVPEAAAAEPRKP